MIYELLIVIGVASGTPHLLTPTHLPAEYFDTLGECEQNMTKIFGKEIAKGHKIVNGSCNLKLGK